MVVVVTVVVVVVVVVVVSTGIASGAETLSARLNTTMQKSDPHSDQDLFQLFDFFGCQFNTSRTANFCAFRTSFHSILVYCFFVFLSSDFHKK